MDSRVWECRYPRGCGIPLVRSRSARKDLRIACLAPELPRATAVKSVEKPARDLRGGLTSQPNFSNNVVGSSSRRRYRSDNGNKTSRLRVAVDVDEVLGRFLHSLNKFVLEEYGLDYDICDYQQYDFASVWGCTLDEANHRVHDFFQSHHFAVGILPIPGAFHSLQRLRDTCDLVVVTSRQHIIQQPTLKWLSQHFPDTFAEVHFGNHWALSGTSRKKSEICSEIGATVLIDDNPKYAEDCAQAGMQVLLYDWHMSYPWAKTTNGPSHPGIQRVRDWNEVEAELNVLAMRS